MFASKSDDINACVIFSRDGESDPLSVMPDLQADDGSCGGGGGGGGPHLLNNMKKRQRDDAGDKNCELTKSLARWSSDAGARKFLDERAGVVKGVEAAALLRDLFQAALHCHARHWIRVDLTPFNTTTKYVLRKWAMGSIHASITRVTNVETSKRTGAAMKNKRRFVLSPLVLECLRKVGGGDGPAPSVTLSSVPKEFKKKSDAVSFLIRQILGVPFDDVPKITENSLTIHRSYAILSAMWKLMGEWFTV